MGCLPAIKEKLDMIALSLSKTIHDNNAEYAPLRELHL